jgi:hypothetical protein
LNVASFHDALGRDEQIHLGAFSQRAWRRRRPPRECAIGLAIAAAGLPFYAIFAARASARRSS